MRRRVLLHALDFLIKFTHTTNNANGFLAREIALLMVKKKEKQYILDLVKDPGDSKRVWSLLHERSVCSNHMSSIANDHQRFQQGTHDTLFNYRRRKCGFGASWEDEVMDSSSDWRIINFNLEVMFDFVDKVLKVR